MKATILQYLKYQKNLKSEDQWLTRYSNYSCLTNKQQQEILSVLKPYADSENIILFNIDYGIPESKILADQAEIDSQHSKKQVNISGQTINFVFDDSNIQKHAKSIKNYRKTQSGCEFDLVLENKHTILGFAQKFKFDLKLDTLNQLLKLSNHRVEIESNNFRFYFDYDPELIKKIKNLPGSRFHSKTTSWLVALEESTLSELLEFIEQHEFYIVDSQKDIFDELKQLAQKHKIKIETNLKQSKAETSSYKLKKPINGTPRPFQLAGIEYILKNPWTFVADDMGLGKTLEAMTAINESNNYPCLIICPNNLKYNWIDEYNKFFDFLSYDILNSNNKNPEKTIYENDIIITNFYGTHKFYDLLVDKQFSGIVIDEGHYLKNSKAKRTKYVKKLVKRTKPNMLLNLTGTPVEIRPKELVSQLKILDKMSYFGSDYKFYFDYCDPKHNGWGWDYNGASNIENLHLKLRQIGFLRRNIEDVIDELPTIRIQKHRLDINNKTTYNKIKKNLFNYLYTRSTYDQEFLDKIKELDEESQIKEKRYYRLQKASKAVMAESLTKINYLKDAALDGKMPAVIEWVENVLETGNKLVLFGVRHKTIDAIKEHFGCNSIDGRVDLETRNAYKNDFQTNPDTKLIILNMNIGAEGITLTAANMLAFIELDWNPEKHAQAIARIYRISQLRDVMIYYLLGANTIDEIIYNKLEARKAITSVINKGKTPDGALIKKPSQVLADVINEVVDNN